MNKRFDKALNDGAISNGVEIVSVVSKYRRLESDLARYLRRALLFMGKTGCPLEVYLVPDRIIKKINFKFRKKDKPTTVLSFSFEGFPHPASSRRPLGEIYLAPDYIKRQGESLVRLAIHGLLHLAGYTHKKSRDKIKMERKESKLLKNVQYYYRPRHWYRSD